MSTAKGFAHEVRPAYLGITQTTDSTYQIFWKIPALGERAPKLYPVFPEHWEIKKVDERLIPGAVKRQWEFKSSLPINGQQIFIDGLDKTLIDVLINIELLGAEQYSKIISADQPFYEVPLKPSSTDVIWTYLVLGVDHIIFGIDHLLFVLALIFVTSGKWKIIKTVTAFTLAHSITLSLAALGYASIPIPPVEAIIALSIVFLAKEILQHAPEKPSLTYRKPWLVAFAFGLLHGFGFASALSETGLPQTAIPLALAFFNIGVELGQIGFVLVILISLTGVRSLRLAWPVWLVKSPIYAIGGISFYWLIDRVVGFF
ncbi:HupE/UreJ family protein [Reichenbachiella sp.]|uniref:HupE/UreJ family protein n=1 Tax=Reichenbachiella sp. TaxID=2184521 RepID=UPI003BAE52D2